MKNIFLSIYFIIAISIFTQNIYSNELLNAVNSLDTAKIQAYLEENQITQEEKGKLLSHISDMVIDYKKTTKSLLKSNHDLLRVTSGCFHILIGMPLAACSSILLKQSYNQVGIKSANRIIYAFCCAVNVILGLEMTKLGIKQTKKGWNLYSAYNHLKRVRKIETLIKNYVIK